METAAKDGPPAFSEGILKGRGNIGRLSGVHASGNRHSIRAQTSGSKTLSRFEAGRGTRLHRPDGGWVDTSISCDACSAGGCRGCEQFISG